LKYIFLKSTVNYLFDKVNVVKIIKDFWIPRDVKQYRRPKILSIRTVLKYSNIVKTRDAFSINSVGAKKISCQINGYFLLVMYDIFS